MRWPNRSRALAAPGKGRLRCRCTCAPTSVACTCAPTWPSPAPRVAENPPGAARDGDRARTCVRHTPAGKRSLSGAGTRGKMSLYGGLHGGTGAFVTKSEGDTCLPAPVTDTFQTEIRAAGQTDLPFIFSTWLKSFRKSPQTRAIPSTLYFKHQHDRVAQLLNDSQTLVACPAGDPDTILGWLCGRGQLIHWVYVKRTWRGIGIGKSLAGTLSDLNLPGEYTHMPAGILPSWLKSWAYNPYLK